MGEVNISADEKVVQQTFEEFWRSQGDLPQMEDVGYDIVELIEEECAPLYGLRFLEAGSGTGRISLHLAKQGADVVLLDTSATALALSRSFFEKAGMHGSFVQASAFALPFADSSFDVVWNTGLIEHFLFDDQVKILSEMVRVLKSGGKLLTFNPSSAGWLYRLGKCILERTGRWHYGREIPIATLAPHCRMLSIRLVKEWSTAFDIQFYYFGKYGLPIQRFIRRRDRLRRFLSRRFGGYLLVSIIEKRGAG
ncbi:MAG: hypothetical protein C4326_06900 [Ignavibacteria bacterium]